ncbi:hypothetical protein ACO0RG_001267 [Hanseniaspora osmophila]
MNNFTGTAKRRNVNLSTTDRRSRRDLIDKASRERERRAAERKEFVAAVVITKNIRQFLTLKRLYEQMLLQYRNHTFDFQVYQAQTLISIFYPSFLEFDLQNDFLLTGVLLENFGAQTSNLKLLNRKLLLSLNELSNLHLSSTQPYVSKIWSLINTTGNDKEYVVGQVIKYLENIAPYQLDDPNMLLCLREFLKADDFTKALLKHDFVLKTNILLYPVFQKLEIPTDFFILNKTFKLNTMQEIVNIIINLSFFANLQKTEPYYFDFVVQTMVTNEDLILANDSWSILKNYNSDVFPIYDYFCNNLIDEYMSKDTHSLAPISLIFKICTPSAYRKSIISVLVQGKLLQEVYENVVESNQLRYLELLIDMSNVYLFTKTNFELLGNRSSAGMKPNQENSLSLNQLLKLTICLKEILFKSLWSQVDDITSPNISQQTIEKLLKLLKMLQVRDNRAKLFKDPNVWTIQNEEFDNVNITNLFMQFEEYYREISDSIEEETAFDDVLKTAKLRDQSTEIFDRFIERKKLMRQASKRQIQKFQIMGKFPSFISFEERVNWFQNVLIATEKSKLGVNNDEFLLPWLMRNNMPRIEATISRDNVLLDSFNAFDSLGEKFKGKLSLTFTNEFGEEAGIDGGGLTKEFLTSVTANGFLEHPALFAENIDHEIFCKPYNNISLENYRLIRFMGKCLGKCLYENVLIDVQFAPFFLNKLLKCDRFAGGYKSSFDELSSMDSVLYKNLMQLWTMSAKELESMGLSFEITDDENPYGSMIELVPNGAQIIVDRTNVLDYMNKVADYKMNSKRMLASMKAFIEGFNTIIPQHWIGLFTPLELQKLISGGESHINISDLRNHTEYGGYLPTDETIVDLWDVLENELSDEEKAKFVKFVTSVPKAPLSGFKALQPLFGIRNAGRELGKLPTSSTCVNLLKLPDYRDKKLLAAKLRKSILSESGFDLS